MTVRIAIDLELHNEGPTEDGKHSKCYDIIQLGYCIFSTKTGILETSGDYIKTGLPLSPYITKLTGITEHEIEKRGVSLHKAYHNMVATWNKWYEYGKLNNEDSFVQICEWGSGDVSSLKTELEDKHWIDNVEGYNLDFYQEHIKIKLPDSCTDMNDIPSKYIRNNYEWIFGNASLNLKAMYQMYMLAQDKSRSGGLSSSLRKLGLDFQVYRDEVAPGVFKQRGKHDARADSLSTAHLYLELQKRIKSNV